MGAVRFFEALLTPLAGQPNLRFLQIGCFAGDASRWMLENILTGEGSILDDVDGWFGSEDIEDAVDFAEVERIYDEQTGDWLGITLRKNKMRSAEFLRSLPLREVYDFAYIDADHTALGTLEDAVAAWPRLKVGGTIAFDDYSWRGDVRPLHCPYPAIDAFCAVYADRCELIGSGDQVWLRKTA